VDTRQVKAADILRPRVAGSCANAWQPRPRSSSATVASERKRLERDDEQDRGKGEGRMRPRAESQQRDRTNQEAETQECERAIQCHTAILFAWSSARPNGPVAQLPPTR